MSKEHETFTDEIEGEFEELPNEDSDPDVIVRAQVKNDRQIHWKREIEAELQLLITEAATIRNKILNAKTTVKKSFYNKKFAKTNTKIQKYVGALQRLEASIRSEGPENDNTTINPE